MVTISCLPHGQAAPGARNEFYYFDDDGDLVAMRWDVYSRSNPKDRVET